jgi:prepilin-type N-terminal cleavage/methylation domain-containing protein
MMKNKGFTIVELLVVIAIVAMLLGILMPALGLVKKEAKKIQNSAEAVSDAELVEIENGRVSVRIGSKYKFLLSPSITSATSNFISNSKMVVKNLPPNSQLVMVDSDHHYIAWVPKERVEQDIVIITLCNGIQDEVTITMEAY